MPTPIEPDSGSIVVMNPEYGMRLSETKELEETYARISDIFTENPQLGKKVGLRTSRKIPFYNATIECRLLKYEMYRGTRKPKH